MVLKFIKKLLSNNNVEVDDDPRVIVEEIKLLIEKRKQAFEEGRKCKDPLKKQLLAMEVANYTNRIKMLFYKLDVTQKLYIVKEFDKIEREIQKYGENFDKVYITTKAKLEQKLRGIQTPEDIMKLWEMEEDLE